jgi:methionyl-tRNA synthetase
MSETPATEIPLVEYADFARLQLRTGVVRAAARHPNADRLLVLQVDTGDAEPRQIVAGIAAFYEPDSLVGKTIVVVVNLKPAKLRGVVSQGMLLAAGEQAALLTTLADVPAGTAIK